MTRKLNLLVVDDDDVFHLLISHLIDHDDFLKANIQVEFLKDGEEAVVFFKQKRPGVDLVLIDQRMPLKDGTDTIRELKSEARLNALPMCLLSSSKDDRLLTEAYAAGANFCFEKPMDMDNLRSKLCRIVDFFGNVAEFPTRDQA